jgi:hypothetical protein
MHELTENPEELLRRELAKGEAMRWSGRPTARAFRRRVSSRTSFGVLFALFGLVWMGVAVLILAMPQGGVGTSSRARSAGSAMNPALGSESRLSSGRRRPPTSAEKIFIPAFGSIFVVTGSVMGALSLKESSRARRTAYAVTDRRAIILEATRKGVEVESYEGEDLTSIRKRYHKDATGDLVFAAVRVGKRRVRWENNGHPHSTQGFYGVPEPRRVAKLLEELSRGKEAPPEPLAPDEADTETKADIPPPTRHR